MDGSSSDCGCRGRHAGVSRGPCKRVMGGDGCVGMTVLGGVADGVVGVGVTETLLTRLCFGSGGAAGWRLTMDWSGFGMGCGLHGLLRNTGCVCSNHLEHFIVAVGNGLTFRSTSGGLDTDGYCWGLVLGCAMG